MAVIGVVGLGAMGLGIAQVYAQAGYSVYATDTQEGARVSALSRLQEALQPRVDAGKLAAETMQAILSAITITNRPEDFAAPDLIIEAIIEDLAIKQALLARLERSFPDAILPRTHPPCRQLFSRAGCTSRAISSVCTSSTPRR